MSGINAGILVAGVSRMRVTFRDDAQYTIVISGTGFWLRKDGTAYFVTNRHNLDPTLKLGSQTPYKLDAVELQLRRQGGDLYYPEIIFARVVNPEIRQHASADAAVIVSPQYQAATDGFNSLPIDLNDVATADFFNKQLAPMDTTSFLGFPGNKNEPWWDTAWNMGIARTASVASHPALAYSNPSIGTSDVLLVSGLSFSGSSGSPVFSHEKGIRVGAGLSGGNHVPAKLIGIMSGHWWNEEPTSRLERHSGLSYLTKSTAILAILK